MTPETSDEQKSLASWCIRHEGRILVRNYGEKIYDGPEVDMPADVRAIAEEMKESPLDQEGAQNVETKREDQHLPDGSGT